MADERPLEFQVGVHPAFAFNLWIKAPSDNIRCQSITLRIGIHPALAAWRTAVMAVTEHHNALAEDASGRIMSANPGMEKNVSRRTYHRINM